MLATTVVARRGLLGEITAPDAEKSPGQGAADGREIDVCPAT
jgi:hypothetical protein